MNKDKGIAYHAKLEEVKNNLEKFKKLSFDLTEIEKSIEEIEKQVVDEINNNYNLFFSAKKQSTFLEDSLIRTYDEGYKKLDIINKKLQEEYLEYYSISSKLKVLEDLLNNSEEEVYSNIKEIQRISIGILRNITKSSTIDYNIEAPLVNKVYEVIYKVIKLELNSFAYEEVKEYVFYEILEDDVSKQYISQLIKKDIQEIDNKALRERVNELQAKDISDSILVDKDLITLIILNNDSKNIDNFQKKYLSTVSKLIETNNDRNSLRENMKKTSDSISTKLAEKSRIQRKRILQRALVLANALVLVGEIGLASHLLKNASITKEYKTYVTTYDSSVGEAVTEEFYEEGTREKVSIVEYSPWDSPGYFRDKYQRRIYKYDTSNLATNYENMESYLDRRLRDKLSPIYETTETKRDVPEDYGYGENKYIVTRVNKDLDDYNIVEDKIYRILTTIMTSLGLLSINATLFKKFSKEKLKLLKEDYNKAKRKINNDREYIADSTVKLRMIGNEVSRLCSSADKEYKSLPSFIKEKEEIKEARSKSLELIKRDYNIL